MWAPVTSHFTRAPECRSYLRPAGSVSRLFSDTPRFGLHFCLRPDSTTRCMRFARHASISIGTPHVRSWTPLDDHLIHSLSQLLFYFIVFPLHPLYVIHDLRFLVDQLPKIGLCSSLCIWQATGCPPIHKSVSLSCIL